MEIETIVQYLLIGNLISGKIIYELQYTNDINIIYEIKNLFNTYSIKTNLNQENIKIESYYINISVEKLIMISKTNVSFTIEQSLELFNIIRKSIPDLIRYPLIKPNIKKEKQSLTTKITNIIYDYFQYVNANKQIISEAFFKIHPKNNNNLIHYHKNDNKIKSNNDKNKNIFMNNKNIKNNSVIDENKTIDIDKSSNRQFLKESTNNIDYFGQPKIVYPSDNKNNNNNNKNILNQLELNQKKEEEEENYNIIKSLHKSRNLFKKENTKDIFLFKNSNNLNNSNNSNNYKNRKIMIFILIIIIVAQIVTIPLIIINSYSY